MADQDTNWTWNFSGPSTMSKSQSRAVLPKEIAWDLIGFDGNETGCLRTHPGFRLLASSGGSADGSTFTPISMSNVRGFWPVTVLTSSNTYVWGYVWAEFSSGTFTFYGKFHDGTAWRAKSGGGNPTVTTIAASTTTEIDVQCSGRFMYFFVRGGTPKIVYLTMSGATPVWSVTADDVGPGDPPKATNDSAAVIRNNNSTSTGFDFTVYGVSASLPPVDGSIERANGNYTFAVQYMSTVTGRRSALSNTTTFTVTGNTNHHLQFKIGRFELGTYDRALIYRTVNLGGGTGASNFYGSGTLHLERVIDLSDRVTSVTVTAGGSGYASAPTVTIAAPTGTNHTSTVTATATATIAAGAVTSIAVTNPGSGYVSVPAVTFSGTGGATATAAISTKYSCATCGAASAAVNNVLGVQLSDTQLVYQDVYIDKTRADKTGPKGGVAQFLSNMLFVSRISDATPDTALPTTITSSTPEFPPRSLGDMRWTAITELTAESFVPSNRWVPRTPGNEIFGMRQVGNFLMGFSTDRIYRIGRQGAFVRVEEGHFGYGLVGPNALETVGTTVYFLSGGGLKAVSMDGSIEDVTGLDNLVNVTWAQSKSAVQMAYDARGQCLTVYNPSTALGANGRAAILWFGTNRMTELVDLPFVYMKTGNVFYSNYLERRALFVKRNSASKFGVYVVDHERANEGTPHNLCGGPARNFVVSGAAPSTVDETEYACRAYEFTANATADIDTGELTVSDYINDWANREDNSNNTSVAFAPLVQQWTGGNLGMQFQPGMPEFKDFFRQKQVSSCQPYYEVISVPEDEPLPAYSSWWALLYRGAQSAHYIAAKPLDRNGDVAGGFNPDPGAPAYLANAPFRSHGASWSSLSPSWRCQIAGVDLRLLAFSLTGRILDTDRRFN